MSNALLALINQRKAATSGVKTIKPNTGRNRYRILPSWRKIEDAPAHLNDEEKALWAAQFYHDFGQHFIKNAAGEVKAVHICVDKTYGRPCPICDEVSKGIIASTDDTMKKIIEEAKSSGRVLLNVLALDTPTPTEPQVLELAPSAFNGNKGVGGIIQGFIDWPTMANMVGDAQTADVIIEKSGAGKDTRYGVSFVPTKAPNVTSVMSKVQNLDKFVAQENAAGLQRALTNVAAVTGLLPAPVRPSLTDAAAAAFAAAPAAPATAQVMDDIPDLGGATAAPAPAPTPAAAPVQQPAASNNDLEALLAGLQ